MTRNLSAGPRKEGLQDTISHSAEFGPTTCTTLFFFSDLHLSETLPSQILVLVSPLSAPHYVCHLPWPSVFWLSFPVLCASAGCFCSHRWAGYLQGLARDNKYYRIILPLALDIWAAASLGIWNFWSSGLPNWSLFQSTTSSKNLHTPKISLVSAWYTLRVIFSYERFIVPLLAINPGIS